AVVAMSALYDPNLIVFAMRGAPAALEWRVLRERAENLEARFGLPFTRYVSKLRGMNRSRAGCLVLHGE
ncbi:MAG: hypothetical protein ABR570_03780, partial [Burkholderiales bacterium]